MSAGPYDKLNRLLELLREPLAVKVKGWRAEQHDGVFFQVSDGKAYGRCGVDVDVPAEVFADYFEREILPAVGTALVELIREKLGK